MHCGDAEALAIIDKQVTEFCLTEAARVGQNSLKDGLKVAWRTGDRAEYLGGRRLLLQCLGKVPPHLSELTGARRGSKLRSTGKKAKARVSNRPNSLSELKKQLEA